MHIHIPHFVGAAALALVYAFFRILFPAKPLDTDPNALTFEELQLKYEGVESLSIVPVLFFSVVCVAGWYALLHTLDTLAARELSPSVYLLRPARVVWLLLAVVLGLFTSAAPLVACHRVLLGHDGYREYRAYTNLKSGFDGAKAFCLVALPIVALCLGLSVLALNTYTQFGEREMVIKRPLEMRADHYPYGRVATIARISHFRAPNGNLVAQPYYAIRFDDGETWMTGEGVRGADESTDRPVIEYVARRSDKPIINIRDIEKLPR